MNFIITIRPADLFIIFCKTIEKKCSSKGVNKVSSFKKFIYFSQKINKSKESNAAASQGSLKVSDRLKR